MHYVKAQFRKRHGYRSAEWEVIRLAYHKYGLKYVALILTLTAYSFIGAGVFLFFEKPAEIERISKRRRIFDDLRYNLVRQMLDNLFNDTERPLIFVDAAQIDAISNAFTQGLGKLEMVINEYNSRHSMEPMLRWDLWTALIYAWTVITTIGYGHLFPLTVGGRISTMLYAIVGIPLMLTALSSVGKLLTKGLKYPFFLVKRVGRRLFRYCTKMTKQEILEADQKDKSTLEVFDLPIPLAIILVIAWIFLCSAITLIWEEDWDYLIAFYFFFISLSTIGFGDVVPSKPYYLLLMFGNTMVGMALVSMLLNLIQTKLDPIALEDDQLDPFDSERSKLRKAFREASIFSNMTWFGENEQMESGVESAIDVKTKPTLKRQKGTMGRRKSMAGGAAVSALSTFLMPLFSMAPHSEKKEEEESGGILETSSGPSQLQTDKDMQQMEKDEEKGDLRKLRPLKKTVSFQEGELAMVNVEEEETMGTVAVVDEGDGDSQSVLVRRIDRGSKKKGKMGLMKDGWKQMMDMENGDKKRNRWSSRRKHRHSPNNSNETNRVARSLNSAQMDSPLGTAGNRRKRPVKRTITAPESSIDYNPIETDDLRESHSVCSICAYQPMTPPHFGKYTNSCGPSAGQWLFNAAISEQTIMIDVDEQGGRENGEPVDQIVQEESGLVDWINRGERAHRRRLPDTPAGPRKPRLPWFRHSICAEDGISDFPQHQFNSLPHSTSEQRYISEIRRDNETQTIISFPSQDSDSRISVSGDRGTTRLLPESSSFTEINRLVNLNINAEILRNELTALALAEMTAAGDLHAYQRVLSLQEMIEQINHEATLSRGYW